MIVKKQEASRKMSSSNKMIRSIKKNQKKQKIIKLLINKTNRVGAEYIARLLLRAEVASQNASLEKIPFEAPVDAHFTGLFCGPEALVSGLKFCRSAASHLNGKTTVLRN